MPGIKENKLLKIIFLILLYTTSSSCQKKENDHLSKITSLPSSLREISGIVKLSDNHLYAINDSGNDNTVFKLDAQGKLLEKVAIPETKNVDWEDLAYDKNDNLYIGDFGNNANKRKNLTIYKVSGIIDDTVQVSEINFYFEDQKKFPPKKKKHYFDVEAFIYLDGYFYLFTKNRGDLSKHTTKLYKLLAKPGNQIAKLIDSYKTCDDPSDCLITAATINKKQNKIALLTHNKVFLIKNFNSDHFFDADIKKIKLGHYSQKEGLCFKNDSILFISDEKSRHSRGKLYQYLLE